MSTDLTVSETEHDIVRVFALDMAGDEAEDFVHRPGNGKPGLAAALGAGTLDHGQIETFPASDLAGLGLAHYLIDGLGLRPDEVSADRAHLDALRQSILILPSEAFVTRDITLAPRPPLEFVGSYRRTEAAPPVPAAPPASARGLPSGAAAGPAPDAPRGSRLWLWVGVAAVVLVAFALVVAFR